LKALNSAKESVTGDSGLVLKIEELQMRNRAQIIKYVGCLSLLSLLVFTVLEILKSIEFFLEQMLLLQLI